MLADRGLGPGVLSGMAATGLYTYEESALLEAAAVLILRASRFDTDPAPATRAPSPARLRGDAWGIGAAVMLAAALACREPSGPQRDPRCLYAGDTIATVKKGANGIVQECGYLTSDVTTCYASAAQVPRQVAKCVVGGPMNGRRTPGGAL